VTHSSVKVPASVPVFFIRPAGPEDRACRHARVRPADPAVWPGERRVPSDLTVGKLPSAE